MACAIIKSTWPSQQNVVAHLMPQTVLVYLRRTGKPTEPTQPILLEPKTDLDDVSRSLMVYRWQVEAQVVIVFERAPTRSAQMRTPFPQSRRLKSRRRWRRSAMREQ